MVLLFLPWIAMGTVKRARRSRDVQSKKKEIDDGLKTQYGGKPLSPNSKGKDARLKHRNSLFWLGKVRVYVNTCDASTLS